MFIATVRCLFLRWFSSLLRLCYLCKIVESSDGVLILDGGKRLFLTDPGVEGSGGVHVCG
jgi:hypothetical protein